MKTLKQTKNVINNTVYVVRVNSVIIIYLEPAHVEEKLQEGEGGKECVVCFVVVGMRLEDLTAEQTGQEKRIDSQRHDLQHQINHIITSGKQTRVNSK